jgi:hypothetical protein
MLTNLTYMKMVWIMLVKAQSCKYHCESSGIELMGIELMSRDYDNETCHGFTIPSYYTKFTLYI